jgi:DNA helicase-2/ATP-dependent DNA helicase PcrA
MRSWGNTDSQSEKRHTGPGNQKHSTNSATGKPSYLPSKPTPPKPVEHNPSPDFKPSDTSELKAGQKVEHQKFGYGEVIKMEGASHNPIATIKFDMNGEKKIMLNYAKLRIID